MDRPTLERELKELLVETLMLESPAAADIASDQPLFGAGLGLDSVDALELGIAIGRRYGIEVDAGDDAIKDAFGSIRALAEFVERRRAVAP